MYWVYTLIAFFMAPSIAIAQTPSCGEPPSIVDQTITGKIEGKAEILTRLLTDASLSGRVKLEYTDVIRDFPNADKTLLSYYLMYQICIIIMKDEAIPLKEKIAILKDIGTSVDIPPSRPTAVCLSHTRQGTKTFHASGWVCQQQGAGLSKAISLGDDTGWKGQTLAVQTIGPMAPEVCIRYTATHPDGQVLDSSWTCSKGGLASEQIFLGDDNGWRDQKLWIRATAPLKMCVEFQRFSPKHGLKLVPSTCSSNNDNNIYLGDDTGWKAQQLRFSIE